MNIVGERNKRSHSRHDIECPITLFGQAGRVVAKTSCLNISNSGTLITVPRKMVQTVGQRINLSLTIPSNADYVEGYATSAKVVRHQALEDNSVIAMGLQFETELQLTL